MAAFSFSRSASHFAQSNVNGGSTSGWMSGEGGRFEILGSLRLQRFEPLFVERDRRRGGRQRLLDHQHLEDVPQRLGPHRNHAPPQDHELPRVGIDPDRVDIEPGLDERDPFGSVHLEEPPRPNPRQSPSEFRLSIEQILERDRLIAPDGLDRQLLIGGRRIEEGPVEVARRRRPSLLEPAVVVGGPAGLVHPLGPVLRDGAETGRFVKRLRIELQLFLAENVRQQN